MPCLCVFPVPQTNCRHQQSGRQDAGQKSWPSHKLAVAGVPFHQRPFPTAAPSFSCVVLRVSAHVLVSRQEATKIDIHMAQVNIAEEDIAVEGTGEVSMPPARGVGRNTLVVAVHCTDSAEGLRLFQCKKRPKLARTFMDN